MAKKSTRDLILSVAATLFATVGFRRATMEAIANAAGRGRRTVYMYFHDKAEIYNAVVDKEISLITAPLKKIISSDGSPEDVLNRYAMVRLIGITNLLKRNPLLLKDFVQSHNRVERLREKLNNYEIRIITPFFQRLLTDRNINSSYPADTLAFTFLNLLRGIDRFLTEKEGNLKASVSLQAATKIFIRGMKE